MNSKKTFIFIAFTAVVFIAAILMAFGFQNSSEHKVLFEKAKFTMETKGDLKGAISLFEQIIKKYPDEREYAAKSQLYIGLCYEKLGLKEAEKAFQKVIDKYPEQMEEVKVAKEKLSVLLKAQAVVEKGDKEFKITKIPIEAYYAFISPDGKKLAFVSDEGDIWVREISSGKDIRLTQTPVYDYWCFWSFDSKTIAYLDAKNGLHVISAKGGESKTLIKADSEFRKAGDYAWPVSWTPDNQMIICHVSSRGLCAIPISGGEWKDIFKFSDPEQEKDYGLLSLSPNGKLIAYQSKKAGNDDIYVMPAEGGESIQITHNAAPDLYPHWSLDGKWLAYETLRTGEKEIWVVKIASDGKPETKPFRVVKGAANPNETASVYNWTKDGKLGISTSMSFSNIFIVDPKSKEEVQLTDALSGNGRPRWSPDGSHIVFISDRGGKRNIWIMPSNGGEPRLVTGNITHPSFFLYMHSPAWSPDGKNIAFGIYYGIEGDKGIWIVPAGGGPVKKIKFDYDGSIHGIDWSPDGKQIAFSYSREKDEKNPIPGSKVGYPDIYLIPVDGGEPTRVTKTDKEMMDFRIPRWSPDGKKIAAICLDWSEYERGKKGASGIYIVDLERGKIDLITESIKVTRHGLSWSPDGENIIFSSWREDKLYLHMVSSRGGEIKNLDIEGLEPDYSPDGKKIVFSRGTGARKEFWLVENFLPTEKTKKK
jgi:Tol biopolymer transport system component